MALSSGLLTLLFVTTALADDDQVVFLSDRNYKWNGQVPSLLGNNTLVSAHQFNNFETYVPFIVVMAFLSLIIMLCGVSVCLICKAVPDTPLELSSKTPGMVLIEPIAKLLCCPDPAREKTTEEQEIYYRKLELNLKANNMDNEVDMHESSAHFDSFMVTAKTLKKHVSTRTEQLD